ncbi:HesA/MoeB/ThiF family protein [Devosia albogilva]|uniref:HesA/MoeB/ThiF family protein n=1 Tax=Devosia albogilva TaxID=429726 RepID=A0ABW5QKD1_9HYPH
MASEAFSPEETRRYSRHLVLKGMGGAGQQKLKAARVLVVGAGGLGSPAIAYLAAAGVGTLGIADSDSVAVSNLQRQVIHRTADIDRAKTESAADFVRERNPYVAVVEHPAIEGNDADQVLAGYDLVLDGTDTLTSRRIVAAAAARLRLPLVSGAMSMFDGQVTVFAPGGPSFEAVFPPEADDADLPGCEVTGIIGPLPGVIGSLMAMEAIKLITGIGTPLVGRVLVYDGKRGEFTTLEV